MKTGERHQLSPAQPALSALPCPALRQHSLGPEVCGRSWRRVGRGVKGGGRLGMGAELGETEQRSQEKLWEKGKEVPWKCQRSSTR